MTPQSKRHVGQPDPGSAGPRSNPTSEGWIVTVRLSVLLAASGYVLWNLAQSLGDRSAILPAAGVAAAIAYALYLFGRYRKQLSKANLLIWALPWVCLALVFFLTASAWHARRYEHRMLARTAFDRAVDGTHRALSERIARYSDFLKFAAPLLEDSNAKEPKFLAELVGSQYPAIAAVGSIEPDGERFGNRFEAAMWGYRFRTAASTSDHCTVSSFPVPDSAFSPTALEEAADTGEAAVSGKFALNCGAGEQDYLLLAQWSRDTLGPNQRQTATLLLPAQLLSPPWSNGEYELDYVVYDGAPESQGGVLYWEGGSTRPEDAWFERTAVLEFGSRTWTLRFQTKESFETLFARQGLQGVPWRGVMLGFVVFGLTWSLAFQHRSTLLAGRTDGPERQTHAQAAIDYSPDAVVGVNEAGEIQSANPAVLRLFGYEETEVEGKRISELLDLAGRREEDGAFAGLPQLSRDAWKVGAELVARHRDGSDIPVEVRIGETNSEQGRLFTLIVRDISRRKKEQEQLQRLASIPDHNPQPIVEADLKGDITYVNPEAARRFPELRQKQDRHPMFAEFEDAVRHFKEGRHRPVIQQFDFEDTAYEQHVCYVPKGNFVRIYVFDITDRRRALHDALTGLPNRVLFLDRLSKAESDARKQSGYRFAVLFVDLDHFKETNDTYGHMIADQMLKTVARRLKSCLRPRDIVARLGGDEFTILLDKVEDTEAAKTVAARIHEHLREPYEFGSYRFSTTASVGIALNSSPHETPSDLLSNADAAMYRAKQSGRDRTAIFDSSLDQKGPMQPEPVSRETTAGS